MVSFALTFELFSGEGLEGGISNTQTQGEGLVGGSVEGHVGEEVTQPLVPQQTLTHLHVLLTAAQ